jgi:serine/threonine protein kinase
MVGGPQFHFLRRLPLPMTMTIRQFVESLSSSNVLSAGDLSSIRSAITPEQESTAAEEFVRKLVQQGKLTKFQAINLFQGRAKGLVFGEYVVLDKLGAGGMGQVFKAQHRRMKRVVALKVLPPHAVSSQKAINRFYQEVEVAAKLTHPNIVTAYDAGETRGLHFLVMEYVEGSDLSSYMSTNGPLGVEQAINVVLQAAKGLAYAHGLGIIHRDIKPANLLLDSKGTVKILDMGLARIDNPMADASTEQNELTASGEVMGTVDYMSPEQAQDTRTADHRSDIYALGCTLYRLLVGKVPYGGDTTIKKILAHRDQLIPSLRAARPDVPEALDRIYQKMLAKNVGERTQSMAQVVAALENLLSGADDEKSSIAVVKEELVHDEPNFNFLQSPGASNVLPSMSALGKGPASSTPSGSGSKSSGILHAMPSGPPLATGSEATPRALPPSVTLAGSAQHAAPQSSNVPTGAVFPSFPAGGAGQKIAKAKRLTPQDEKAGGKSSPPGGGKDQATDNAGPSAGGGSFGRAKMIGAGVAAVAIIGIAAIFLFKSPTAEDAGKMADAASVAAAIATAPQSAGTKPAAPQPTSSASMPAATTVPAASATATLPKFPDADTAAMNFFNAPPSVPPVPDKSPPPDASNSVNGAGAGSSGAATANSLALPPKNAPPPAPPLTTEVNLLEKINPADRPHHSTWVREGSDVVCQDHNGPHSRVIIPFNPPEEYDVSFTARGGDQATNIGLGLMIGGRHVMVCLNDHAAGIDTLQGHPWHDRNNPSHYAGNIFDRDTTFDAKLAVRTNRIVLEVGGKPTLDYAFTSAADLPAKPRDDWKTPLGELFLHAHRGARFTALSIGPPEMKLPAGPMPLNLAAAFDKAKNGVEGEFTASRNEIFVNGLANKWSKLGFDFAHAPDYALRLVVERRSGADPLCLSLPTGAGRFGIVTDWSPSHRLGIHPMSSGGADINATSRQAGLLFMPGVQHVLDIDVRRDPKGHRLRLAVDGRNWIDYAGSDFGPPSEAQTPEPRTMVIATHTSAWRILRIDIFPEGEGKLPIPSSADRSATETALRSIWASADAKNAPLDAKQLMVDALRRRAAEELEAPAVRYVALEQALRIALEAGDLPGAYESAYDLTGAFAVDGAQVHQRLLDVFKVARPQAAVKQKFADDVLRYMERAAHDGEFGLARSLAEGLDKYLGTTAGDMRREVRARETEYELWSTLKRRAADEAAKADGPDAANSASRAKAAKAEGLYLAVALQDWAGGMALLTGGDDPNLAAAAQLETGELKTGEQLQSAADKWWEASEAEKWQELKWALAERAAYWYRRAAPLLPPKARTALDRRKTQIAQLRKASGGACGPRRPLDTVKIGDRWYKVYASPVTQTIAEQTCEELGGQLCTIESPQENDAVTQYLLKSSGGQERAYCWLGYSDAAQEGQFRNFDGAPLVPPTYANWSPGQPDNQGGTEDGVLLEAVFANGQFTGNWVDGNAAAAYPFICEWDR